MQPLQRTHSMAEAIIGIDLGKNTFHVCVLDAQGRVERRRAYTRSALIRFLANTAPATVAMEACPGAHHIARKAAAFGHQPLLLPAQYVKPYIKSQKNDALDAEAIAEAASRPTVRQRAITAKSEERQTLQLLHRQRSGWIGERTALGNRIRAMLLEFGLALPKGLSRLRVALPNVLEDAENGLPDRLRALIAELREDLLRLDARIGALNAELSAFAQQDPLMKLLMSIPGIGPINGTALLAGVGDASQFRRGRDLAAWLGLVPRQHSTGGKTRLLGISKHGNRQLRMMLIHGARAVIRVVDKRASDDGLRRWVERITARKHPNVAVTALANKLARIVCAVLQRRQPFVAAQVTA